MLHRDGRGHGLCLRDFYVRLYLGCMGNNRWKCVKASSQCVKLYRSWLSNREFTWSPLPSTNCRTILCWWVVMTFVKSQLLVFLNSAIKTKDKIKIAHLHIYQFNKKNQTVLFYLIRPQICSYKVCTCLQWGTNCHMFAGLW